MNETEAASVFSGLPPVLRAREYRLYLEGKLTSNSESNTNRRFVRRLTDLWLDGGKAVLGHKQTNVLQELKNAAERGLFSPFPHPLEKKFIKALTRLFSPERGFPNRCFRIFSDEASLRSFLGRNGLWPAEKPFPDPAFPEQDKIPSGEQNRLSLWRPFLEKDSPAAPILVPVLPWPLSPKVLVLEEAINRAFTNGPAGDLIAPALLAPAARAVHDLLAAENDRAGKSYPRIAKALSTPGNLWQRRGIYLSADSSIREDWSNVWKRFFDEGFLLPPRPSEPLILPGTLSPGEEAKLAALLAGC